MKVIDLSEEIIFVCDGKIAYYSQKEEDLKHPNSWVLKVKHITPYILQYPQLFAPMTVH